jgi:hypothetical protein
VDYAGFQEPPTWPVKLYPDHDGALTYIHKVKDGKDIYFFANSRDTAVDTKVVLRGKKALELWDPLTGERRAAEATASDASTTVRLVLDPVSAVFFVGQ